MTVHPGVAEEPSGPVLLLAPHTDDVELGAGATVARWTEAGREVHYLAFSACEASVPAGFPPDVLRREVVRATAEIGIPAERVTVLDFEVRHFPRDRQALLQHLVDLGRELRPGLVLLPAVDDLHQDHAVVAAEGLRAFKRTRVLAYEIAWNTTAFRANCLVRVEERHLRAKIAALGRYESQGRRSYTDPDFLRAQLRTHGVRAGSTYAEAFEVVRWLL